MKVSISIVEERPKDPHYEYSPTKKVVHCDVEALEADAKVIAAMLRGLADQLEPKSQVHYKFNPTPYGGTLTNGVIDA